MGLHSQDFGKDWKGHCSATGGSRTGHKGANGHRQRHRPPIGKQSPTLRQGHRKAPSKNHTHQEDEKWGFHWGRRTRLPCWPHLKAQTRAAAQNTLQTLGASESYRSPRPPQGDPFPRFPLARPRPFPRNLLCKTSHSFVVLVAPKGPFPPLCGRKCRPSSVKHSRQTTNSQ